MNNIKKIYIYSFILFFIELGLIINTPIYSQFITPDNEKITIDQEDPNKNKHTQKQNTGIVQNILVSITGKLSNNIQLVWTPGTKQDDYIVARSNTPIYNNSILRNSKSIAVIPPGKNKYVDKFLQSGTYYYAIASRKSIKNNTVQFVADQNYTVRPITISHNSSNNSYPLPPSVSLIHTEMMPSQVAKITWKGVASPNIIYVIYRSQRSFDSKEMFAYARKIAEINDTAMYSKANHLYHIDKTIPKTGSYYYAVVCKNIHGIENRFVVPDQSYTRYPIGNKGKTNFNAINIKSLQSKIHNKTNVLLQWRNWDVPRTHKLIIYRSSNLIQNTKDISSALMVATITANQESYIDRNLAIGSYFYSILVEDQKKKGLSTVSIGENSTIYAVNVIDKIQTNNTSNQNNNCKNCNHSYTRKSLFFFDLNAIIRNNMIFLYWKNSEYTKYMGKNNKIYLYRFTKKPRDLSSLADSVLVAKLPLERAFYEDIPTKNGMYFYALFIETPKGLLPYKFEVEKNLVGPILLNVKNKKEPILIEEQNVHDGKTEDQKRNNLDNKQNQRHKKVININIKNYHLNKILKAYYLSGQYYRTIQELQPFTKSYNAKIKAKAYFYIARSYYNINKFERALDFFVKPIVMKNQRRARFWYKRTLEKIK